MLFIIYLTNVINYKQYLKTCQNEKFKYGVENIMLFTNNNKLTLFVGN